MYQGWSLNEATYEGYTPESLKQGGCGFCDPTSQLGELSVNYLIF